MKLLLSCIPVVWIEASNFQYLLSVSITDTEGTAYWECRGQIDTWLRNNLKSRYCYAPDTYYTVLLFKNEEDRNWFILRWS